MGFSVQTVNAIVKRLLSAMFEALSFNTRPSSSKDLHAFYEKVSKECLTNRNSKLIYIYIRRLRRSYLSMKAIEFPILLRYLSKELVTKYMNLTR